MASQRLSVAAAEALVRSIGGRLERQRAVITETELQLRGAQDMLEAARAADRQSDLVASSGAKK